MPFDRYTVKVSLIVTNTLQCFVITGHCSFTDTSMHICFVCVLLEYIDIQDVIVGMHIKLDQSSMWHGSTKTQVPE